MTDARALAQKLLELGRLVGSGATRMSEVEWQAGQFAESTLRTARNEALEEVLRLARVYPRHDLIKAIIALKDRP